MNIDINLTHEQHDFLLARLGCDDAIRTWIEETLDQELRRLAAEKK